MNMPLLDIQPRTLTFVVDQKQSSCVVQLTNITHHYAAFKVKTTSPKKYCVRPNVGVVAPNSSFEFTVIMQALKEPPPNMVCKDKFLVQSITVPAGTADEDITTSMFSKMEGKHVEENKLRVTLVLPPDSPELSPVNGTPKQEAVFENSILKDRLYNQSETIAPSPPHCEEEIVKEPRMIVHDEVKASDDAKELKPSEMDTVDFVEDLHTASDLKATKGSYVSLRMTKETKYNLIRSRKDADDEREIVKKAIEQAGEKAMEQVRDRADSLNYPDDLIRSCKDAYDERDIRDAYTKKKAMEQAREKALGPGREKSIERARERANEQARIRARDRAKRLNYLDGTSSDDSLNYPNEPNIPKDRDVVQLRKTDGQNVKSLDKLVKDMEEMKLKVNAFESKIKQADSTISKLMEERSISSEHKQSLQHELAAMKIKKIVKEVYTGFPLLFVFVVAFISIVIGYSLRT